MTSLRLSSRSLRNLMSIAASAGLLLSVACLARDGIGMRSVMAGGAAAGTLSRLARLFLGLAKLGLAFPEAQAYDV